MHAPVHALLCSVVDTMNVSIRVRSGHCWGALPDAIVQRILASLRPEDSQALTDRWQPGKLVFNNNGCQGITALPP